MPKPKKKQNYFKITSPKVNKLFFGLASTVSAVAFITLLICIAGLISINYAEEGRDIPSLFEGYMPFIKGALGVSLVLLMAFLSVVIYNYALNRDNDKEKQATAEAESPFTENAKGHEQQIIDLMSSIIKPLPDKETINQAKTAKFYKALSELKLIDSNLDNKHFLVWIEYVTEYPACETRVFNQALKAIKVDDPNVPNYKAQLEQIIAK